MARNKKQKPINWNHWHSVIMSDILAFNFNSTLEICKQLDIRHNEVLDDVTGERERVTADSLLRRIDDTVRVMLNVSLNHSLELPCRPLGDVNMYLDDSGVLTAEIELVCMGNPADTNDPLNDLHLPAIVLKLYDNRGKHDRLNITFAIVGQLY